MSLTSLYKQFSELSSDQKKEFLSNTDENWEICSEPQSECGSDNNKKRSQYADPLIKDCAIQCSIGPVGKSLLKPSKI